MLDLPTSAITVANICYEYPGVRALDDVSFNIKRGGVTALVGPNGAGKTTLLRCIAGLDRPMLGTISLAGIDVLDEPRLAHERIGYLSDFFGLYDTLSVRRTLAYAAAAHGVKGQDIEATVALTAAQLSITSLLDRRCSELSRGQRQRTAIGQAIVHKPQLLLLDEPAAGLDPEARHALAKLFTQLRDGGMTLLVSSHILAELDEYSTDMLVLRGGKIIEHRSLVGVAPGLDAAELRRIRIGASREQTDLHTRLTSIDGIEIIESSNNEVVITMTGNINAQVELLRTLINSGLPICNFSSERENLHTSYLRTVSTEGEIK